MKKIVYLFIFLNSEKNEPRSTAAVIGPFGLSLRSPSGGLRNSLRSNSPRPFPSVSLASSPPDKGGINRFFFRFYSTFFFNPSVLRTPPLYFALQNTGEKGEYLQQQEQGSIYISSPAVSRSIVGHGNGGGLIKQESTSPKSLECG